MIGSFATEVSVIVIDITLGEHWRSTARAGESGWSGRFLRPQSGRSGTGYPSPCRHIDRDARGTMSDSDSA